MRGTYPECNGDVPAHKVSNVCTKAHSLVKVYHSQVRIHACKGQERMVVHNPLVVLKALRVERQHLRRPPVDEE